MPKHSISKELAFTQQQLFDMVADIESYPEFLPWCERAKVVSQIDEEVILADLWVKFNMARGKYRSRVALNPTNFIITVRLEEGPFEYLNQNWQFHLVSDGSTLIEFDIDFKLNNPFLERVMDLMFDRACSKMMHAFEKRAEKKYSTH